MIFMVCVIYFDIYRDLSNRSLPFATVHVVGVLAATYLCDVIDSQPVNSQ